MSPMFSSFGALQPLSVAFSHASSVYRGSSLTRTAKPSSNQGGIARHDLNAPTRPWSSMCVSSWQAITASNPRGESNSMDSPYALPFAPTPPCEMKHSSVEQANTLDDPSMLPKNAD